MKELIQKNKGVIKFIVAFLLSYAILSVFYFLFLNNSTSPDAITMLVADQSMALLNGFGYETYGEMNTSDGLVNLFTRGRNVVFIMEGCNAVSIMILFLAFVVAFAKDVKSTLLFALVGLVLIYSMNLLRIVFLTISLYHYPRFTEILHGVVFPAIIYGAVFILWMFWVRSFKKPVLNVK